MITDQELAEIEARAKAETLASPTNSLDEWSDIALITAYHNGGLARVTYERMSAYTGPDHPGVCTKLIKQALKAALLDTSSLIVELRAARDGFTAAQARADANGFAHTEAEKENERLRKALWEIKSETAER